MDFNSYLSCFFVHIFAFTSDKMCLVRVFLQKASVFIFKSLALPESLSAIKMTLIVSTFRSTLTSCGTAFGMVNLQSLDSCKNDSSNFY